jgi:hypothetical protein
MGLGAWKEITDVYGGKITRASYKLSGKMVTVRTSFGSSTTHIGGHNPQRLARTLLRELVDKRKA